MTLTIGHPDAPKSVSRQTNWRLVVDSRYGRTMREYRDNKVPRTESKYPNIVELAVARDGLATQLSRQISVSQVAAH